MYRPNFNYNDKIVKNLTFIAESKAIIINSSLIPEWEVSLRKEALIHRPPDTEEVPELMEEFLE